MTAARLVTGVSLELAERSGCSAADQARSGLALQPFIPDAFAAEELPFICRGLGKGEGLSFEQILKMLPKVAAQRSCNRSELNC